jgi:A/G-specific adenine glycosylase
VYEDYGGVFPDSSSGLKKLPGIGSYTAAAIASLVYNEPVLAIDGNVKRLASRLFELSEVSEKSVSEKLQPLLPEASAGAFNEALIELGAMVCRAKNPACDDCPVATSCQAFQHRSVAQYPPATPKRVIPSVERFALLHCDATGILLRQRQEDLLGGLWGFPLVEQQPSGRVLGLVKHVYTHFRIQVTAVEVSEKQQGEVIPLNRLSQLALSRLDYKILELWRSDNSDLDERLTTLAQDDS